MQTDIAIKPREEFLLCCHYLFSSESKVHRIRLIVILRPQYMLSSLIHTRFSFVCLLSVYGASFVAQLVKNPPALWGDPGAIPGWGRSPGEGNGYPLQCPDLENPMDCIVLGVSKSRTRLSDFHYLFIIN